jgi:hypothetical protein
MGQGTDEGAARYSAAELRIIHFLQTKRGRPMTLGEIDLQLEMAKSILGPDLMANLGAAG